jgi:hypothetical protein
MKVALMVEQKDEPKVDSMAGKLVVNLVLKKAVNLDTKLVELTVESMEIVKIEL